MLTEKLIRSLEYIGKTYQKHDGKGLYIEVPKNPEQKKRWRFKYTIHKKQFQKSLGTWPDVSLREARELRDEALLNKKKTGDIDLSKEKNPDYTFQVAATAWLDKEKPQWTLKHYNTTKERFKNHVFPFIGYKPLDKITTPEIFNFIQRIVDSGHYEMAKRMRANISRVFRYCMMIGKAEKDPAEPLKGALPSKKVQHLPGITDPKQLGQLLRDIDNLTGFVSVRYAAKLAPHLFVRPGELRHMEWSEIDFEDALWRIPASKMKRDNDHLVPLSNQVLHILKELHPLTGHGRYLFPQIRSIGRPMSDGTLNAALKRLGYTPEEIVAHGFRTTASTLLNEVGFDFDWIERQLSHSEKDKVRAAYNRAEYLKDRRIMMQKWSDMLEDMKEGKALHE